MVLRFFAKDEGFLGNIVAIGKWRDENGHFDRDYTVTLTTGTVLRVRAVFLDENGDIRVGALTYSEDRISEVQVALT